MGQARRCLPLCSLTACGHQNLDHFGVTKARVFPPFNFAPGATYRGLASGDLAWGEGRKDSFSKLNSSAGHSGFHHPLSPHRIRPFCSATGAAAVVPRDKCRKPLVLPRFRRPRHPTASTAISKPTSKYPLFHSPDPSGAGFSLCS